MKRSTWWKRSKLGTLLASGVPSGVNQPPKTFHAVGEPVELTAAGDGDGESLPTFQGTAYTGGVMRPVGFHRDVYVDLAGCQVAAGSRPIHRDHDTSKIVGHVDAGGIEVGKRKIKVAGKISGTGAAADEVRGNGKNGFPWRMSIGASIERIEWVEDGKVAKVNGINAKGPCYVVRACTIYEVSFVSLAGDDRTSATVTATIEESNAMNFQTWLAARGHDINELTAAKLSELRAAYDREVAGDGTGDDGNASEVTERPDSVAASGRTGIVAGGQGTQSIGGDGGTAVATLPDLQASRRREADEVERVDSIRTICARYDTPRITVGETEVSLQAHAIREGWDANRTELEAMRQSRPSGVTIHTPQNHATPQVLECSLAASAGVDDDSLAEDYDDRTMNAAKERSNRDIGLQELICRFILANGGHVTPGRFNDDTIRTAFQVQRNLEAAGGTGSSTYSLPGILSNVANKAMQAAYRAVPDVLSRVAYYGSTNDFKEHKTFQLTASGEFAEVGIDGELKQGGLIESEYSNQAKTRGQVIMLTRIHMRNDDLGAFLRIPRMLARKGATVLQKVGMNLIEAGAGTFFKAANKNYLDGASSALGIDSLTSLSTLFETQTDPAGDPIGVTPSILLTAPQNKVLGRQLYDETKIQSGNTGKVLASNPHAGMFEPLSSPFLTANTDAWYLFADPNDIPAIEVVFLDGRRAPIVEAGDLDFTHLGMGYRAYNDFGAGYADHRGAAMSKGKA
ncbi:phage major capsid protein [Crateriforma conspicua]|uniref:Mu-like prophage major head subunit gpT n=1 Tax=Crateriforma conspicua TaxID=2527996 RepID=A0A5C5XSH8_9PLAN|nr:hypothetical protein [Crateriforma conspicua]TWT65618.1 hypothetical protein Pan14r_51650 [Crateriforma conspicua]